MTLKRNKRWLIENGGMDLYMSLFVKLHELLHLWVQAGVDLLIAGLPHCNGQKSLGVDRSWMTTEIACGTPLGSKSFLSLCSMFL